MSNVTTMSPSLPRLRSFVEHPRFRGTVLALIIASGILLGLETSRTLPAGVQEGVLRLNQFILGLFVIELALRIGAYRLSFFREYWNLFDFVVVAVALMVPTGPFQVIRSLRILRAVRIVSSVPSLRRVVEGLLGAIPGIASVLFLLLLVLYISAVMATGLFRDIAPEHFGHLGMSLFSLFQIMTLEGWAEIAQQVMTEYPWSWVFFVGYILVATFLVLNLVVGVVVSSIQARIEAELAEESEGDAAVRDELSALRVEIRSLREALERKD